MPLVLRRVSDTTEAILVGLRNRLRRLAVERQDRITERAGDYWISWRSQRGGRVFAELRPTRNHLEIFLLPSRRELRGAVGLARPAPESQGWGWFRSRMFVTSLGQVPQAFALLRQSYDWGRRRKKGPPGRRRGRGAQGRIV